MSEENWIEDVKENVIDYSKLIKCNFDPRKARDGIRYILSQCNGNINYINTVLSMLYYADAHFMGQKGLKFCGGTYETDSDPRIKESLDVLNYDCFYIVEGNKVMLTDPSDGYFGELSIASAECLNYIISMFKKYYNVKIWLPQPKTNGEALLMYNRWNNDMIKFFYEEMKMQNYFEKNFL